MAETGYCFNVRRLRLQEKLVLLRYDPIGKIAGRKPAWHVPGFVPPEWSMSYVF